MHQTIVMIKIVMSHMCILSIKGSYNVMKIYEKSLAIDHVSPYHICDKN
jgi:hypothetical protein